MKHVLIKAVRRACLLGCCAVLVAPSDATENQKVLEEKLGRYAALTYCSFALDTKSLSGIALANAINSTYRTFPALSSITSPLETSEVRKYALFYCPVVFGRTSNSMNLIIKSINPAPSERKDQPQAGDASKSCLVGERELVALQSMKKLYKESGGCKIQVMVAE